MTVHNIETDEDYGRVITEHPAVLIDFFAIWCAPCKVIAPFIADASNNEKYKDIHFVKIDLDKLSKLADDLDIQAMPTLVLFKGGKRMDSLVDPSPQTLIAFLEKGL